MSYLKLNQTIPDPYAAPEWAQAVEDATSFDTREQAEASAVRVEGVSGVIYDDQEEYWYVVRA
jgi:hypothetical protein